MIRLVLVALLLGLAWQGTWFEIEGRGVYTEGLPREPTIWANYTIDASEEAIDMEITNATPLLVYLNERESLSEEKGPREAGGNVDAARTLLAVCFGLTAAAAGLDLRAGWQRGLALAPMAALVVMGLLIPLAAFADFGMDADEEASGGFAAADSDAASAQEFVHTRSDSSFGIGLNGVEMRFYFGGHDLGLIEAKNRTAAAETEPADDAAWIGFEGRMTARWGDAMLPMLAVPGVLFLMRGRSDEDDGGQPEPHAEQDELAGDPGAESSSDGVATEDLDRVEQAAEDV